MTSSTKPKVFGSGLIALDLIMGADDESGVRSWTGGTCGNVLSILAYLGWQAFPIARLNGDAASQRVKTDMKRWGVRLDFAECVPKSHTPIIIQQIRKGKDGLPRHKFSWSCPKCGEWLPGFKAVTQDAVNIVKPHLQDSAIFFMDRLSRAILDLAKEASAKGALVAFEPSSKSDPKHLKEALDIAHVVKYADERFAHIDGVMTSSSTVLTEIQTLGPQGLRYRHRLTGRSVSNWMHLDAVKAPKLADTCGSGDWCTAGLLSKIGRDGIAGLRRGGATALRDGLQYGQALAAWNCGFEGARGGMYSVSHQAFNTAIRNLLAGKPVETKTSTESETLRTVNCPACQPHPRRRRSSKRSRAAA